MMESHRIAPRTFFTLEPLTENAARLYLLSGRGKSVADLYLSAKLSPQSFFEIAGGEAPGNHHFLYSAPLVALALRQNGHVSEAKNLISFAEATAKASKETEPLKSALLARVYAVEGRNEDAVALLTGALSRGFIPQAPELLPDMHLDPALASLKGDPRFERSRQQLLGTIARERAQVNQRLLDQLKTA
jgi:hypothetical protein